jgi:hypothetical protein
MSRTDYEAAVAMFLKKKTITRCPTVCIVPTQASTTEKDRAAYRSYVAEQEAARLKKSHGVQKLPRTEPGAEAAVSSPA